MKNKNSAYKKSKKARKKLIKRRAQEMDTLSIMVHVMEESGELLQSMAKYLRNHDTGLPTREPISLDDQVRSLWEETDDMLFYVDVLRKHINIKGYCYPYDVDNTSRKKKKGGA